MPSVSVAGKVPQAATSALLHVPVVPAVKMGEASLRSVTVAVMVIVSVLEPSVTWMMTVSYTHLTLPTICSV